MSKILNMSLRAKLLFMTSVILTITVLSLIAVSYFQTYNYVIKNYTFAQHNVAENIARIVNERLIQYATNIETLSKSIVIENTQEIDKYQEAIDSAHKSLNLLNLLVAFDDGKLKGNSAFKAQPNYDHRIRGWYKDGIAHKGLFLTKAYMDANVHVPCITMTYPITTKDGTKGVISFDIVLNFDILFEEVANKDIGGKFYILEPDGTIISTIDDSLILKKSSEVYSKELTDFIEKVVSGEISSKTEAKYDLNGSRRIGVITKVENFDVYLLYGANLNAVTNVVQTIAMKSLIFGVVLLIISNVIMMFTISYSLRDLKNFQRQITEVAHSNDLTRKITSRTNDELGEIAEAVNMFISSMSNIINEVKNSIIEVASANNELAATMEELSATFSSQSSQVSDMVEGMGEVSEISRNTSDALAVNMQSLEDTANATRVETEKLDTVSQEMGIIEQDTVELSENIRSLSASSVEIGNILGVINDIANQTNLLALNAAIEAARAGEAGRGFAVVADEVRKLAERTQDATKEIENIIGTLQRETETATQAMDKSVESVHTGTENIRNVTEEIKRAVENVTHLYTDMRPVADSVANQYIKIEDAVNNARSVSSGIDESNSAVNEVNNTVSHLQQRTEYLKRLIEQFKV